MSVNKYHIKGREKHELKKDDPNIIAIEKYQDEISILEEKSMAANEAHNWSMRNFYDAQLYAKYKKNKPTSISL